MEGKTTPVSADAGADPRADAGGGELVLVTGGSGYVGTHVISGLLRSGHRVRTTVRSHGPATSAAASAAASVRSAIAASGVDPGGRLDIVSADLTTDDGWDDAMAGCTHVHHVASPFPSVQPDNADELIVPARDGTLRVLRAARDHGVKRVVMTSSFAAVGYSHKDGDEYDESDWTDPEDDNPPYIRSKTIAELAAWDFVAKEGDGLELTVINPTGIFGPALGPRLSASAEHVRAMLEGAMPAVPRAHFGMVDVRDVADLHLRAMAHPAAAGQRFLASGDRAVSFLWIARVLAEHLGERAARVPTREFDDERAREAVGVTERVPILRTEKARSVFGWTPRDPVTTILDTAESLFRLGLVKG
ncbi:aldehyde reductase [Streptomyces sp. MK37H]|uniref:SDR family oxidoreductase n=1 Tax=Streptomyces sp. MK37H TaxID=2699117 RepID=UPI001B369757|nr:aldehyde reductase [Streptomyces sp. MK37H]MBP8531982.1 NAD-dependent epimerase/dehydratase family protein [Streptomyces sp. MK37H]